MSVHKTNPFHRHDEDDNEFVGTFSLGGKSHDVWIERLEGEEEDTIIVRYGDEPAECWAFPHSVMVRTFRRFPDEEKFGRALSLYEAFQNGRASL
jgi:hypothetical protein